MIGSVFPGGRVERIWKPNERKRKPWFISNVCKEHRGIVAIYLPYICHLYCILSIRSQWIRKAEPSNLILSGQLVKEFSNELGNISQKRWCWRQDSLNELTQTLLMSLENTVLWLRKPTTWDSSWLPRLAWVSTVFYGHISGHQLHRSRNSVLMHSELTGLLRAELQEPYSWGTENKIKCEDFPRIGQCLSGPQTKLVIKKAHSHEEDGINRREVGRFKENISHESGKADKISLLGHSTFYQLNWRNTDHLWILIPLLISEDPIPLGDMLPQMY